METCGQRIRRRREQLGFKNQAAFARLLGIAQSTLSEIETGQSKMPSAEVLLKMSEVLEVSQAWIITGKDGEIEVLTPEEEEHIRTTRQLTAEQRHAVYQLVKSMPKDKD